MFRKQKLVLLQWTLLGVLLSTLCVGLASLGMKALSYKAGEESCLGVHPFLALMIGGAVATSLLFWIARSRQVPFYRIEFGRALPMSAFLGFVVFGLLGSELIAESVADWLYDGRVGEGILLGVAVLMGSVFGPLTRWVADSEQPDPYHISVHSRIETWFGGLKIRLLKDMEQSNNAEGPAFLAFGLGAVVGGFLGSVVWGILLVYGFVEANYSSVFCVVGILLGGVANAVVSLVVDYIIPRRKRQKKV